MKKSKFIVLEGLDCSGKTTICQILKLLLHNMGIKKILTVREPGSTKIAEKIRNIIKYPNSNEIIHKKTNLLLIYAARIQLIENIIRPSLKKNIWIISDRYDLSSYAYQGGGFKIKKNIIQKLQQMTLKPLIPDLTIYLDVLPKNSIQRSIMRNKEDKIEKNSLNFFNRTRNIYLKLIAQNYHSIKIDANLKSNIVQNDVINKFKKWFQYVY
ncbi:Thymidylate kinase [Buchnera aphidicola (Pterocallis alni)]|uniref:dTMP kinase n=1 Tax=Buchnera aphidicola TaxID=9 RepID=UPI003464AFE6